jgi:hypothetical protein
VLLLDRIPVSLLDYASELLASPDPPRTHVRTTCIRIMQLEEWRAKCLALEDTCMRFQSTVKDGRSLQDLLDRMQQARTRNLYPTQARPAIRPNLQH